MNENRSILYVVSDSCSDSHHINVSNSRCDAAALGDLNFMRSYIIY